MSKFFMLIVLLCAILSGNYVSASNRIERVLTLDEIYTLADECSKSIRANKAALDEAGVAVREAQSNICPMSTSRLWQVFSVMVCLPTETSRMQ